VIEEPPSWRRLAAPLVVFAACFGVTLGVVNAISPPAQFIRHKFDYLDETRDTYDVLFFGASNVYRGVIPKLFDATARSAGLDVTSYNVAMASMRSHEADYVLHRVLAARPAKLRWVIVEFADWVPFAHPANRLTEREIQWHDARTTQIVLRSTLLSNAPDERRKEWAKAHALHFGANLLQLGRAAHGVRAALSPPEPRPAWIDEGGGFRTYDEVEATTGITGRHRRKFRKDEAGYLKLVGRLEDRSGGIERLDHYNLRALEQQIETIRAAGATPIYLVPPNPMYPVPEAHLLHERGVLPHLIALDDPHRYPELFLPENRFDKFHVNEAGAREMTRAIARRFVEIALD